MAYEQFASHYDRLMEDMPYADWIRFAQMGWDKLGRPKTVVDLGCGTGTLALRLAQLGYQVTGIDLSEEMLAIAEHKAERLRQERAFPAGGSLTLLQQDMREWELPEQADAVVSFCDCFNYLLEEDDVEDALRQVFAGLKPGGSFLFDVHAPAQLAAYAENEPFFLNDDDIAYIWTCDFDEERCEIEHALTIFVQEGAADRFRRIEELHSQRAYALDWWKEALRRAGFADVQCCADFAWSPPNESSQRLFFAAVRP